MVALWATMRKYMNEPINKGKKFSNLKGGGRQSSPDLHTLPKSRL